MQSYKFGQHNADQKGVDQCKEHLLNKENTVEGKTFEWNFEEKKNPDVTKKTFLFKETQVYCSHCGLHFNGGTVKHENEHTNEI